jgi:RHS repeat-associated protein
VRRVVARCTGLALSQAATALPFTLQLTATINGHLTTRSLTGTAIVLARGASAFGAGWSLAGLEQLYFPQDTTQLLWVSGDGSARIYHRVGNTNSFLADSVDGPDSLTRNPATLTFTRFAPGGLRIHFDSAGEHATTVNRLGQTTTFAWSGGLLQSITVPPTSAGLAWHFTYTSGHLSSVTAPPGPGGARTVTVYASQSPARLDSVKDLDGRTVRFTYAGTPALLTRRIDQLHDTVTFTYGTANTLAAVTVQPDAVPAHALTTSFLPADVAGLTGGAVVDPATVVSKVITPGADTTIVSLDRFGQPLSVRDAIGETTTITRGDTRWPALATRVTAPNGYTTAAAYDGSGRLVTDTAIAPFGGSNAITSYSYENTFDQLTRVVGPTGEVWRATYDATTGERLAEAVTDTGSLYETTYRYDATCQMVRAVTAPLTPSDSVGYDARCNPRMVRSPGGAITSVLNDTLGRIIRTTSPVGLVDSMTYDAMDRVLTKLTIGPARGSAPSQTVAVTMAYDSVGRDTMVTRTINPDPAGISALITRTGFDRMGRVVRETAPDSAATLTKYDSVAGDPIKVFTRLGGARDSLAITMVYDKLHRLRTRTVPKFAYPEEDIGVYQAASPYQWRHAYPLYPNVTGQTGYRALAEADTFVYATSGAAAGTLTHANNGDAKVTRTYYANGAVATETDSLRTLKALGAGGGDFTHHIYTETYAYDLAGRLTTLVVPPQLAPRVQTNALGSVLVTGTATIAVKDTIRYAYATGAQGTGALSQVTGLLPGEVFTYHDTPRGEVDSVGALVQASGGPVPRPVHDAWSYTPDGAVLTHHTFAGTLDTLRFRSVVVDSASRVVSDTDLAHGQPGLEPTGRHFLYSGLGHLLSSTYNTTSSDGATQLTATEAQAFDPLGNWTARANTASDQFQVQYGSGFSTSLTTRVARYEAATGRLRANTLGDGHVDTLRYDAAGNLHATLTTNPGNSGLYDERVSYYTLDGHLVAADARSATSGANTGHTAFEEYRYDALGRRIWIRVRRLCDDQYGTGDYGDDAACEVSTVRRTVWSGTQELAEIEMPAFDSTWHNPVRTPADTVENDTLPIHRRRNALMPGDPFYDANRLYGRVLYVVGLSTDQPLAITRMNYADASYNRGDTTWALYAPYSILPLWNDEGRTDRAVMGGTAAPGADSLCASPGRCAYVAFDRGEFPFARSGSYEGVWQGTLLVDKADATGTYYRRNRSYDPNTARFTQQDPLGLAGGLNVYGFASGDPVSNADPSGLWCERRGSGLHCEDIGPGDAWAIRDYLGGSAGQSFFEDAAAAGWTRWSPETCRRGFSDTQCSDIAQSMSWLINSSNASCSALGTQASRRFQAGNYRLVQFKDSRTLGESTPIVGNDVQLGDKLWGEYAYLLTNTIAHEEAHYKYWFKFLYTFSWVHHDSKQNDFIYQLGNTCAQGHSR